MIRASTWKLVFPFYPFNMITKLIRDAIQGLHVWNRRLLFKRLVARRLPWWWAPSFLRVVWNQQSLWRHFLLPCSSTAWCWHLANDTPPRGSSSRGPSRTDSQHGDGCAVTCLTATEGPVNACARRRGLRGGKVERRWDPAREVKERWCLPRGGVIEENRRNVDNWIKIIIGWVRTEMVVRVWAAAFKLLGCQVNGTDLGCVWLLGSFVPC